jgi:hypothetical protein
MTGVNNAEGVLFELYMGGGGLLKCPPNLVPPAGKYIQAVEENSKETLAASIFSMGEVKGGFLAAPVLPPEWVPGTRLLVRGPLGHGFSVPEKARRILLVAFKNPPHRLQGLIGPALEKGAEVVLITNEPSLNVPEAVEIQPLAQLSSAWTWADAVAADVAREDWSEFLSSVKQEKMSANKPIVQVLLRAPMPCAAIAECGICAFTLQNSWKMICKDGPVFDLTDLIQII